MRTACNVEATIDTEIKGQVVVLRPAGVYGPWHGPKECRITFRGEHGSESVTVSVEALQQAIRAVMESR